LPLSVGNADVAQVTANRSGLSSNLVSEKRGTYSVEVDGLSGSFTVAEAAAIN